MKTVMSACDKNQLFEKISKRLGVPINASFREIKISIPEKAGTGSMTWFEFENGLALFLMNATLNADWQWEVHTPVLSPLFINYTLKGEVKWVLSTEEKPHLMKPQETFFVAQPEGGSAMMIFRAGQEILFSSVRLNRKEYLEYINCPDENMSEEITFLLKSDAVVRSFFYKSKFSTAIAALVIDMLGSQENGVLRAISIEAKARELFSLQFRRAAERIKAHNNKLKLDKESQQKIALAREILIHDIREAPTIEELAKRTGINRQKLKAGFKLVYERTINQYLTEKRLEIAKKLLQDDSLSIREVSAAVGYENPSYLARLFKEKYGVLPHFYQEVIVRRDAE